MTKITWKDRKRVQDFMWLLWKLNLNKGASYMNDVQISYLISQS